MDKPPLQTSEFPKLSNFSRLVGIRIEEIGENYARMRLTPKEEFTNFMGILHGGVMATLADTCMGILMRASGRPAVTVELTTNYLSPSKPDEELIAEATVVHWGSSIIIAECSVSTESGKKVATAKGIFFDRQSSRDK